MLYQPQAVVTNSPYELLPHKKQKVTITLQYWPSCEVVAAALVWSALSDESFFRIVLIQFFQVMSYA